MEFDDDGSGSGSASTTRPQDHEDVLDAQQQQQQQEETVEDADNEAMFTEEQPDGSYAASSDKSHETKTPRVSKLSDSELDALYARLDRLRQDLAEARAGERRNVDAMARLNDMERERDRYRAVGRAFRHILWGTDFQQPLLMLKIDCGIINYTTSSRTICSAYGVMRTGYIQTVLSLAYQNKLLNDDLNKRRQVS